MARSFWSWPITSSASGAGSTRPAARQASDRDPDLAPFHADAGYGPRLSSAPTPAPRSRVASAARVPACRPSGPVAPSRGTGRLWQSACDTQQDQATERLAEVEARVDDVGGIGEGYACNTGHDPSGEEDDNQS